MNWINVKDRMPEENTPVLVCFINKHNEQEIQAAALRYESARVGQGYRKGNPRWYKCGSYKQNGYNDYYDAGITSVIYWAELEFPE